jgi:hypothetical protein
MDGSMKPEQFKQLMEQYKVESISDPESAHSKADQLMCRILDELGYGEGVAVFEEVEKWYA